LSVWRAFSAADSDRKRGVQHRSCKNRYDDVDKFFIRNITDLLEFNFFFLSFSVAMTRLNDPHPNKT